MGHLAVPGHHLVDPIALEGAFTHDDAPRDDRVTRRAGPTPQPRLDRIAERTRVGDVAVDRPHDEISRRPDCELSDLAAPSEAARSAAGRDLERVARSCRCGTTPQP